MANLGTIAVSATPDQEGGGSLASSGGSSVDEAVGVVLIQSTFLPTTIVQTPGVIDHEFTVREFTRFFSGANTMEFTFERGKRPSEEFQIGVNFEPDMLGGDSPLSHTVTAEEYDSGTDVTGTFLENATLDGYLSYVTITGGTSKTKYRVIFEVLTAAGNRYEHSVIVQVLDNI